MHETNMVTQHQQHGKNIKHTWQQVCIYVFEKHGQQSFNNNKHGNMS
jgi:hypothetical protein